MQPVLCLLEDERARRIDYLVGNFIAPMRRQTMHKDGIGLRLGEQLGVYLIRLEDVAPRCRLGFLSHACPHVGVNHVSAEDRKAGIVGDGAACVGRAAALHGPGNGPAVRLVARRRGYPHLRA